MCIKCVDKSDDALSGTQGLHEAMSISFVFHLPGQSKRKEERYTQKDRGRETHST